MSLTWQELTDKRFARHLKRKTELAKRWRTYQSLDKPMIYHKIESNEINSETLTQPLLLRLWILIKEFIKKLFEKLNYANFKSN